MGTRELEFLLPCSRCCSCPHQGSASRQPHSAESTPRGHSLQKIRGVEDRRACGVAIGMGQERRGGGQCDRPQASRLWGISQASGGRPDPGGVNSLLSLQLLVVPPVPLPSARPGLPSLPASPQPHSLSRRQAGLIASCTDSLGHCWLQVQAQPAGPGPRPLQPLGQGFSERASVLRSRVERWQPRRQPYAFGLKPVRKD